MNNTIVKYIAAPLIFGMVSLLGSATVVAQSSELTQSPQTDTDAELNRAVTAYQNQDYATSFAIWSRFAALGNPDAINNLGELYRYGQGVTRDEKRAFLLYKEAADRTDNRTAAALYNLATFYYHGIGTQENEREAFRLMTLAANAGWAEASYDLGTWYTTGYEPGDEDRALIWFKTGARQGNASAAFSAGMELLSRSLSPTDRDEAMVYIEAAAEYGNKAAMGMMARDAHADYAMGGPKEAALKWYDALIAQGDTSVVYDRRELDEITPLPRGYYLQNTGRHKDAYESFTNDCKNNKISDACYEAGMYLANGDHVARNYFGAMLLFEDVCLNANKLSDAVSEGLGCIPFANTVVLQNGTYTDVGRHEKARKIFKDSCDRNNQNTLDCYNVAFMSWDDRFSLKNESLSRRYSAVACNQHSPQKDACRMQQAWGAEDNYTAVMAERSRANRNRKPGFVEGLLGALVVGANQIDTSGNRTSTATQYGEMRRQQDAARHSYVMSTHDKGSMNYGRCPTVNSPGC